MTSLLDKLNLRPGERRLVVFGALAVFVVLNIWLVWPQFGKVSFWNNKRATAQQTLEKYNKEIRLKETYEKERAKLERLGGQVPVDEQAIQLQKDVLSYAALTGVAIESSSPIQRGGSGGRTNIFFEEQTMQITVNTGERELIDFLFNLGKRNSMIRVRTMNLGPDATRMRLKGQIALVASYQKKPPARSAAAAAATAASRPAATKPATNVPPARTNVARTNAPAVKPGVAPPPRPVPTTAKPSPSPTIAATSKTNAGAKK
jgi:hypothetical protein